MKMTIYEYLEASAIFYLDIDHNSLLAMSPPDLRSLGWAEEDGRRGRVEPREEL